VGKQDSVSGHAGLFARNALAAVFLTASWNASALAQPASPPNFAPDSTVGWYIYGRQFMPPANGAGPVRQHPDHPYVTNDEFRVTGRQPTAQLADLDTPILQPWARDVIRKRNELVLAGKPSNQPHDRCWPVGVGFLRPYTQASISSGAGGSGDVLSSKREIAASISTCRIQDVKPSGTERSVIAKRLAIHRHDRHDERTW
jgi:hypothetical protein